MAFGGSSGSRVVKKLSSICLLGDSFIERNDDAAVGSDTNIATYGIFNLTNMLLQHPFHVLNIDGVDGSNSASFLLRLSNAVLQYLPKYAYIQGTVNDILSTGAEQTLTQQIANYSSMFSQCNAAGITVITNTVTPFTGIDTAAKRTQYLRFNSWLADVAPSLYDVIVLRNEYQYLNPANLNCQPLASITDGIHPGVSSSFRLAQSNASTLLKYGLGNAPLFNGAGSPNSEDDGVHPNPISYGSAGAIGTGVTGSVSTGMGVRVTAGGVAACSKIARADGPGEWQQVVYTPSAANQICEYYTTGAAISLGNAAIGDIVTLFQEFEIDAVSGANFRWLGAQIYFAGINKTATAFPVNGSLSNIGSSGFRGIIKTPPLAIPAGTTGVYLEGILHGAGASLSTTARFGQSSFINYSRQSS